MFCLHVHCISYWKFLLLSFVIYFVSDPNLSRLTHRIWPWQSSIYLMLVDIFIIHLHFSYPNIWIFGYERINLKSIFLSTKVFISYRSTVYIGHWIHITCHHPHPIWYTLPVFRREKLDLINVNILSDPFWNYEFEEFLLGVTAQ